MSTHDDLLALMLSLGGVTTKEWCAYHDNGEGDTSRYLTPSPEMAEGFIERNYEVGEEEDLNPRVQVRTIITWPNGATYHSPWKDVDEGH
jgi:hypothetical protein